MAREIMVTLGEATSSFAFTKVDRSKLYGQRKRVPMDPDGKPCEKAGLTPDGALLVRAGMTSQGYFDEAGYWYPLADLQHLGADGVAVARHESTLGVPQPLTAVPAQAVLDLRVHSVYALDATEIEPALQAALDAGGMFGFDFTYRAGHKRDQGVLLANPEGLFALIGQPVAPDWCALDVLPEEAITDDADAGFDDDLDFEMF